ncbi:Wzz/FepE/Etk N-terminal domain-containing protein, partial [Teichococcus oryzae]|uniref:Wzz/FepE/Etk N-terminal domain-containing protein n=1 Tax=Teichococcus oryzae TaxID=1608942 RepID=UPI0013760A90
MTDLLSLLWQRKLTLITTAFIAGVLGYAVTKALPVRFASEGLLLVESRDQAIPELNQTVPSNVSSAQRIRTEADILRSRALAADVVRELGLADKPEKEGLGAAIAELIAPVTAWVRDGITSLLPAQTDENGQP